MRSAVIGITILAFSTPAFAGAATTTKATWRVAESANACLMNCDSQEQSCKRLCPATYNTPCISACDNQAQFCRQSCQQK
jgi:hypothetical protein